VVHQRSEVWLLYPAAAGLAIVARRSTRAQRRHSNIVPTKLLLSANTLIQVSYILALVFGATLAGFVVICGACCAILFGQRHVFRLGSAHRADAHPANDTTQSHESARTVWGQLVEGLRYVIGSHLLVRVLAITAIAALGIGAIQILGLNFLNLRLNVTEQGFGLTMAMVGIGVAIGGAFVQRIASRAPAIRWWG